MKNLIKTDFDNFYETLNEAWYDLGTTAKISFAKLEVIINASITSPNNDLDYRWYSKIKDISQSICAYFETDISNWPYQLQLQYNSYQSEKLALDLLNNNAELKQAINKALKAADVNKVLAEEYDYNDNGHKHTDFSAEFAYDPSKPITDFKAKNTADNTINTVEVKATAGKNGSPSNMHNAELVFVFHIDTDTLDVLYWNDTITDYELIYMQPRIGLRVNCIRCYPQVIPELNITIW